MVLITFILLIALLPKQIYNDGVCTRRHAIQKTKLVTYWADYQTTETYKCGFLWLKKCTREKTACCRQRSYTSYYTDYEKKKYCCNGYTEEHRPSGSLQCKPYCTKKCQNGRCSAPEVCSCDRGYKLTGKYTCDPVCSKPCSNGTCTAPETCSCNTGYNLNDKNRYLCDPICSTPCAKGRCVAPETCSCDDGYKLLEDNTCKPICSNGTCVTSEMRYCDHGYKLNKDNNCSPICSTPCSNGTCVSPETCSNDAYQLGQPLCPINCINGNCTGPQICTCFDDHYLERDGFTCSPICAEKCINGYCSSPNKCTCFEDYYLINGTTCVKNGTCEDPETCPCQEECLRGSCTNGSCKCADNCNTTTKILTSQIDKIGINFYIIVVLVTTAAVTVILVTIIVIKLNKNSHINFPIVSDSYDVEQTKNLSDREIPSQEFITPKPEQE